MIVTDDAVLEVIAGGRSLDTEAKSLAVFDAMNAITSEASRAGLEIEYDVAKVSETLKRRSLERWDNEGGAISKALRPSPSDDSTTTPAERGGEPRPPTETT